MTRYLCALAIATNLPAASLPPVEALVARAGKQVQQFWDQMAAVHCTERVLQIKLDDNGKHLVERRSTFDYLVLMQLNGDEFRMDESRVEQGKAPKHSDRALLTTSGFSTLILIFHPLYQDSFRFTLAPGQEGSNVKVHFAHIHGKRSPAVLQLRNREYPIEWEGDASIDPASGAITHIEAGLAEPLADVGLRKLSADVVYGPVQLKDVKELAWLPQTAVIEAQTVHQHWRNEHSFSEYKQFGVSVDTKTEGPAQPKQ